MFSIRGTPRAVRELALFGSFCSASVLVVTTAGTAQLLADEGSDALPLVYLLLAAVSIPVAWSLSRALGRRSAIVVCRTACLVGLGASGVLQVALLLQVEGCNLAICTIGYVLEIILDTMFWLVAADYLPTRDLKRYTPKLAMAFAVGGVVGGVSATLFCWAFSADYLMLLACALLAVCSGLASRISRRLRPLDEKEPSAAEPGLLDTLQSSCAIFRSFPIAGLIATSILLMSALFCLQDYLSMTIFAETFAGEDELARFMSLVFAGQQACELLVLATCGSLVIERAGPLVRNLVFPLSTALCLIALLGSWTLPVALLVSFNANSISNGVFEPVKTMNYAAVPYRSLGPIRMLVEGMIYPLGIAGSGAGLLVLQSRFAPETALSLALLLSAFFLGASALLGAMYVPSMIRSLRVRTVSPSRYARSFGKGLLSRSEARKLLTRTGGGGGHAEDLVRELFPRLVRAGVVGGEKRRLFGQRSRWAWMHQPAPLNNGGVSTNRARSRPAVPDFETLAFGLDHARVQVRHSAAKNIAGHGDKALPWLATRLRSERPETAEAAILALGLIGSRRARHLLRRHLQPLLLQAQRTLAALAEVRQLMQAGDHPIHGALFCQALEDRNHAVLGRVLAVQAALGHRRDISLLHHLAVSGQIRERSDAIEALTSAQAGRFLRPHLHLLEPQASPDEPSPCPLARPQARRSTAAEIDAILWAAAAEDWWLRLLVAPLLTTIHPFPGKPEEVAMLNVVLFLKSLPLFNPLRFECIARAAAASESVTLSPGDPLPATANPCEYVHILRDGHMELLAEGCAVHVLEPGAFLGVGAVIGDSDGDVAARAISKCHLLRLPASVVADLAAENPQMLRTLLRDTHRLQRAAYLRLAGGPATGKPLAGASGGMGENQKTEASANHGLTCIKNRSVAR